LQQRFRGKFRNLTATYHPADLVDDPPGKASNTAWAFKCLLQMIHKNFAESAEHILLTTGDADSEFHERYFETLSQHYCMESEEKRDCQIWQAPVLHVKNYRRQPAFVVVGTVFCCMDHLSQLADPNAVRFPYSTYSMSLKLAVRVGGWDTQWIAEDWHMGIKCFLLTLGQTQVKPIMLPILNYAPEDTTWWGTITARWAQAKRHALGFSDLSYYFMTLPLVLGWLGSEDGKASLPQSTWALRSCGVSLIVKIVNTHVALGVGFSYGILTVLLRGFMEFFFRNDRFFSYFLDSVQFCLYTMVLVGMVCMTVVAIVFVRVYALMRNRIEDTDTEKLIFRYDFLHAAYLVTVFSLFGGLFYVMITLATFKAALSMLTQKTFEYEVAAKPVHESSKVAKEYIPSNSDYVPAPMGLRSQRLDS